MGGTTQTSPLSWPPLLPSLLRSPHCPNVNFWVLQTTLNLNWLESRNYTAQGPARPFPPEPVTTSELSPPTRRAPVSRSRAAGEEAP